jgi:hypothetical protein
MKADVSVALGTLEQAHDEVAEAEKQLAALLSDIQQAPRAEKTSVSRIVEDSLRRLRAALVAVETAKQVIAAAKD